MFYYKFLKNNWKFLCFLCNIPLIWKLYKYIYLFKNKTLQLKFTCFFYFLLLLWKKRKLGVDPLVLIWILGEIDNQRTMDDFLTQPIQLNSFLSFSHLLPFRYLLIFLHIQDKIHIDVYVFHKYIVTV